MLTEWTTFPHDGLTKFFSGSVSVLMTNPWNSASAVVSDEPDQARDDHAKAEFQIRFKRALNRCIKRGFSVEECFGMIWEETLEASDLPDAAQSEIYPQLIAWAKQCGR